MLRRSHRREASRLVLQRHPVKALLLIKVKQIKVRNLTRVRLGRSLLKAQLIKELLVKAHLVRELQVKAHLLKADRSLAEIKIFSNTPKKQPARS